MPKHKLFLILTLVSIGLIGILYNRGGVYAASSLSSRLQGYILLQVESVGEAWYVIPKDQTRVYMPNGSSAYQIMRYLSLGITNADLSKIPVGIEPRFNDQDQDQDGLSDNLEKGLGTDPNKADTDNDSFSDGEELKNNFNPLGASKLTYNTTLVNRLKGYILLQVEKQGQAWYLNPSDGKRYYMQDGDAAYQIMRFLSLGITNQNLNQIRVSTRTFSVNTNPPGNNGPTTPPTTPTTTPPVIPPVTPPGGGGGGGGTTPPAPDYDSDNDGYNSTANGGSDCNDSNANIRPNATEICDSIDNNCNGQTDEGNVCVTPLPDYDNDNDGYNATTNGGDDCNDSNASIHPGATEICSDGVDQDCSSADLICSTCSEGLIASRCLCNSTVYTSGYCCSNVYQINQCTAIVGINITSISSSSLVNGSTYTINGSGFGIKNPVAPTIWDDFQSDVPGQSVPNLGHGAYWNVQVGDRQPYFSNAMQRTTGDVAILQDYTNQGNKGIAINQPWVDKLYVYMWLYRHDYAGLGNTANNAKISGNWWRLPGPTYPENRYELQPSNAVAHLYSTPPNPANPTQPSTPAYSQYSTDPLESRRWNQWFLLERYMDIGDINQYNAVSWVRTNGAEKARVSGLFNVDGYTYDTWWFGLYFVCQSVTAGDAPCPVGVNNVPMRQYIGEIYADTTLARVMICDQNTWSNSNARHCEIQLPQNIWNNNQIQFKANRGSFTTENLYLYVLDDNDNVNQYGYPVSFSGTAPLMCIDTDADGYGSPASSSCVHSTLDCDNSNASIHPGAVEICGNSVDEDCSGSALACSSCVVDQAVPTTGCACSGVNYYSGYCCSTGWQNGVCPVPTTPSIITLSASGMNDDSLLGIPRRKMLQAGNRIWLFHSSGRPYAHYSSDGGLTWSGLDYFSVNNHGSFDLDSSGNIHDGERQSNGTSLYRRIDAPATQVANYYSSNNNIFSHFATGETTAAAVLAHNNNVFMFSRASYVTTIYYDVSTDNGLNWNTQGVLASSLASSNRVGAIIIDNMPYAFIWEQMSSGSDRITFYRWDGSSFALDSSLTLTLETQNLLTRVFSVTQTDDGNVHVAYWNNGSGNRIRHVYKKRTDTSWSTPVTVDDCNTDCLVNITAHGNNIFAAYLRPSGGFNALTYRKFNSQTRTWDSRVILDATGNCRYPAMPQKVDASSSYIPLAWTRGVGLYYSRISIN